MLYINKMKVSKRQGLNFVVFFMKKMPKHEIFPLKTKESNMHSLISCCSDEPQTILSPSSILVLKLLTLSEASTGFAENSKNLI